MKDFWIVATIIASILFVCSILVGLWWRKNHKSPGLAEMISPSLIIGSMIVLGVIAVICLVQMLIVLRK